MNTSHSFLRQVRFSTGILVFYACTLLMLGYAFWPGLFDRGKAVAQSGPAVTMPTQPPPPPAKETIFGQPVRLVVPKVNLDLPVRKGEYNEADQTWTLVDGKKEVYFALLSTQANDTEGNTFIYGHNNRFVLGKLKNLTPGDKVHIYTENQLMFTYSYQSARDLRPDETTIFDYQGPPQLTLQTCTGNWYELRRFYTFQFDSVEPAV